MKRCFCHLLAVVVVFSAVALLTSASGASSNVLFILDGSNSMWGQVDGVPKIVTAKKVLVSLLKDLPEDTNVGIMVYGHRSEGNCRDVELLVPIGPNDPSKLAKRIETIQPKGKTPITYSLEQSLPLFASLKGQNNYVVLVSDGKETCGGDPCQAAKKLAAAGVGLKIHVVGFDVSGEERRQLECIAKGGRGRYFNAKDTEGLKRAFVRVKREVTLKSPKEKWVELGGSATKGGVSNTSGLSYAPCVAVDSSGRVYVAWEEVGKGKSEIYLKMWDGKRWGQLGRSAAGGGVSSTAKYSRSPDVKTGRTGDVYVAWTEKVSKGNGEIYMKVWDGRSSGDQPVVEG